jgi:hypothetical protein
MKKKTLYCVLRTVFVTEPFSGGRKECTIDSNYKFVQGFRVLGTATHQNFLKILVHAKANYITQAPEKSNKIMDGLPGMR